MKIDKQIEKLKRSLGTNRLVEDILVCNSIIERAGEPGLIKLFKSRRNLASNKLNQWR